MIAKMGDLLSHTRDRARILCGFNVFGYEDALAVVQASVAMRAPILLMVNRAMAAFMPPEICGPMLCSLAQEAATPIGIHLDHARDLTTMERALRSGFTSVMYDGSKETLDVNIQKTSEARELADRFGATLEGEVGTVPYTDLGETEQELTTAKDATRFVDETGVDALAISIGNLHRLTRPKAQIDFKRLNDIENALAIPLVLHGASGLPDEAMHRLLRTRVSKLNIGTRLRQAFAAGLRSYLDDNPDDFDRLRIMKASIPHVHDAALAALRWTGWTP